MLIFFEIEREIENDANAEFTMMPMSLLPIYLSLDATTFDSTADSSDIIRTIEKSFPDASMLLISEAAEEVARAKGGELHNISALTGGMVAQEVIKIITKQYIPIDNTCIFDGITSRTQVLRI
jgi:amyloid beta precursor protein binding protein 1